MTKTKRQLRAEAVERLRKLEGNAASYADYCKAMADCPNEFLGQVAVTEIIDLLTDDEPPEGDAVKIMRKAAKGGFPGSKGNIIGNAKVLLGVDGTNGIDGSCVLNMLADMVERDYVPRKQWAEAVRAMKAAQDRMEQARDERDELRAAISERYMELPVDADGVPIKLGDKVVQTDGEYFDRFTVEGFTSEFPEGKGRVLVVNDQDDGYYADSCRHIKPRTLEDVLRDFLSNHPTIGYTEVGEDSSYDREIIARYADEIRDLFGGGAE